MPVLKTIYSIGTLFASPLVGLTFVFSSRGRKRLWQRFGIWNLAPNFDNFIWIHAASMGEMKGMLPIIRHYHGKTSLLITATSPSALELVKGLNAEIRLLPFDHRLWISCALAGRKPKMFIFGETEIWPNLIDFLHAKGVQLCMVNARISDRSIDRYAAFRRFFASTVSKINLVLCSDKISYRRLIELGANHERVFLTGNTKNALVPTVRSTDEAGALKAKFFRQRQSTLVLGSLRPGEENVWFPLITDLFNQGYKFNVVVAPRHSERFAYFARRLTENGLRYDLWSKMHGPSNNAIVVLDELGRLEPVYSFADLVFIGGTFVDIGGHNILEAAAYAKCICVGPYCDNIKELLENFVEHKAIIQLAGASTARVAILKMLSEAGDLNEIGQRALAVWQFEHNAAERTLQKLEAVGG